MATTTNDASHRSEGTLPALLRAAVDTYPDKPAVISETSTLTFIELWHRATAQATVLRGSGVRRGDTVGLFLEPGERLIAAVWGVLLAGASYVPLAVDYPGERIRYMIDQSRLVDIITDEASAPVVRKLTPDSVRIHLAADENSTVAIADEADRASAAYVIFTSGSTGKPKGVVVSHAAITHQMWWLDQEMHLGRARILLKTPTSFDAAQWELLANAVGGTIVVGPAGIHRDPPRIIDLVHAHGITHLQCVPTLWRALTREPGFAHSTSLTRIFSGGEALTSTDAGELMRALPHAELVNLYGPTETTINATFHRVSADDLYGSHAVITIGEPIPGCAIHILDATHRPVAGGGTGQLAIGGPQVASGYIHDPARTSERFITLRLDGQSARVYLTGDVVSRDAKGNLHFHGRSDDQVKINGHRIETDEVRLAIEQHHWVRSAAVVPWTNPQDGLSRLAAFVELDPHEAALMDADRAGQHHRSKKNHEQVRAQLTALTRDRNPQHSDGIALPKPDGTPEQRLLAFARKTYRFYDGDELTSEDVNAFMQNALEPVTVGPPVVLNVTTIAELLRWFGPFNSDERLLPKYAYASPGALTATTIYLETAGIGGLADALYEYRPATHQLRLIAPSTLPGSTSIRMHFVGDRAAIEAVYSTNVDEVLHFEAGHMVGLLEHAAGELGYFTHPIEPIQDFRLVDAAHISTAVIDLALEPSITESIQVRTTVQLHDKVADGRSGTYDIGPRGLQRVSTDVVERRHVIAINQETYDRSSFGVGMSVNSGAGWRGFVELGRTLQRLQMNTQQIGLMSAGYSSMTGRDLPSANRYREIVGEEDALMYLAVGGPVTGEQIRSVGMREDSVHTRGPEEILRDDLRRTLPYYMVPSRVTVVDTIPVSSSGKHDRASLIAAAETSATPATETEPPATDLERSVLSVWNDVLDTEHETVTADFFDVGGNSLHAVQLINRINKTLRGTLPIQTVFEQPTVRALARMLSQDSAGTSRLIKLAEGPDDVLVIWPGLGGYPMNLRALAKHLSKRFTVYAVQTHGLNAGETPYPTLRDMIDQDIDLLAQELGDRELTLAGYSFGARIATEVATAMTKTGNAPKRLTLLAPGSPFVPGLPLSRGSRFDDAYFRQMAYSVFLGHLPDHDAASRLEAAPDKGSFLLALAEWRPDIDSDLASRILAVAETTFEFRGHPAPDVTGLLERMDVITATGDSPSFLAETEVLLETTGQLRHLTADHYSLLHEPIAATVAETIAHRQLQDR